MFRGVRGRTVVDLNSSILRIEKPIDDGRLLPARGEVLVGLHPLQQGQLAVTNGAANPDKGWPVAPHAGLR